MDITLSIGDFSRMTYLSVRTLRRYHAIGLLEPAHVDPDTGYRRYTTDQVQAAQVIRRLRAVDMPLETVHRVLDTTDDTDRDRLIAEHLTRIEDRLDRTRAAVTSLRSLLLGRTSRPDIGFVRAAPVHALAIAGEQPLDDAAQWFRSALDELHALVPDEARTGPDGALYYPDFFHAESGSLTVFVPAAPDTAAAGRAGVLDLPATELAVARHDGPLGDLDRTYGQLGAFVAERAVGAEGPIRESFVANPEPDRHIVEVGWPVSRSHARS